MPRFDIIFTQKTRYETLNQLLKRIHQNKTELPQVPNRPDIPLHTNGSETDIRDFVKKRKVREGHAVMKVEGIEILLSVLRKHAVNWVYHFGNL